jgi:alkylation response protein AidB-like acyl-CoA dehydrogenase
MLPLSRYCEVFATNRYLTEFGLEKIVRDPRMCQIPESTNEIIRVVASRSVLAEAR